MYAVLTKETHDLPVLISKNKPDYADYILSGYQEIFSGTLKACQDIIDEIVEIVFQFE